MLQVIGLHTSQSRRVPVALVIAVLMAASVSAQSVSLGAAHDFCVLGLDGVKLSMTNPQTSVSGNVGLGPAGLQNFADGFIGGTYTVDSTANNSKSNNVVIVGGTVTADLSVAVADAQAASAAASALAPTQTFGAIKDALTIFGGGGVNVIAIESISYSGATDKLTFDGGPSDVFIVNVSGSVKLSHKLSRIQVGGGVSESAVLFNLTGAHDPLVISGGATIAGTYLAPNAGIRLSPAVVIGGVIGGGDTSLTSAARVECVPFGDGGACVPDFGACTTNADCCGGFCEIGLGEVTGTCQPS
jgi:choice-of-anchor A domain-containing protein